MDTYFYKTKKCLLFACLVVLAITTGRTQNIEDSINDIEAPLKTTVPYSSFGEVVTDVVKINNNYFVSPGVTMGMIFNHRILIAGYANFLINQAHLVVGESLVYDVKHEYGGIWVGYIANPIKNLQFGVSSKFGKGDMYLKKDGKTAFREKQLLTATPQFDLYIKCTNWMKIYLSTGYRFTSDLNFGKVGKKYFEGPNTSVGIIFGECGKDYCF